MFENITFNKYPKNCHKANDANVSPWPGPCVSLFNHSTPPAVAPQWSSRHPKHRSNVPATVPATLVPSPGGKVNVRNVWEKPIFCVEIVVFLYFLSNFTQFTSYEFILVQVSSGFILACLRCETYKNQHGFNLSLTPVWIF